MGPGGARESLWNEGTVQVKAKERGMHGFREGRLSLGPVVVGVEEVLIEEFESKTAGSGRSQ